MLLFIILLLPAIKLLDYACEQSARLDEKPVLVASTGAPDHSDLYSHKQESRTKNEEQNLKPAGRGEWVAKGLVVSLVVIISIGLVRQRTVR